MHLRFLKLKLYLIISILIYAQVAISGPWISSGGDLLKDARNPWFIFNTPKVNFCVAIDSTTSSASIDGIRSAVKKSLLFWEREFLENKSTNVGNLSSLPLVVPTFNEVACDGREDLAILLGVNTLNPQQKAFISQANIESVASAVRTNYDPVNLKAKGFIYITGDRNKKLWVHDAWSDTSRLTIVLAHELGHVLGVPHMQGDYASVTNQVNIPLALNLMSENLPQAAVLERTDTAFRMSRGIIPILSAIKNFSSCNISASSKIWFQVNSEITCLKIVLEDSNLPGTTFASIFANDNKGQSFLIGSLKLDGVSKPLLTSKFDIITQVNITSKQNVFKFGPTEIPPNTMIGGTQIYATLNLRFVPAANNKISKSVIINMEPMQFSIMGILGESFIDLFSVNRIRPLI